MSEKLFPIRQSLAAVAVPNRFTNCDCVEIEVKLTPMRWDEMYQQRRAADSVYSVANIVTVEAKDGRAVFHITRQMIDVLMREYLGVDK